LAEVVDGQGSLLAEVWGAIGRLRVHMALHAGEAIPDARGDDRTAPLNRLSRLLATGYGSQILLPQTVQQRCQAALPPGADLRDLGEHQLCDLLTGERVFQLLPPNLPSRFPPVGTVEAYRPPSLSN
jgi:class 3 adenylate cyclase